MLVIVAGADRAGATGRGGRRFTGLGARQPRPRGAHPLARPAALDGDAPPASCRSCSASPCPPIFLAQEAIARGLAGGIRSRALPRHTLTTAAPSPPAATVLVAGARLRRRRRARGCVRHPLRGHLRARSPASAMRCRAPCWRSACCRRWSPSTTASNCVTRSLARRHAWASWSPARARLS